METLQKPFNWISEKDKGIYDAMNKGLLRAKGEWLYFIGADDTLFSDVTLNDIFKNQVKDDVDIIMGMIKYNFKENDSHFLKKNNGIFISSLSNMLWIKNTIHHQSVFYKRKSFSKYSLKYHILSDYHLNLKFLQNKMKEKRIENVIATCGTEGISKKYSWNMYLEEIALKIDITSIALGPLFFVIVVIKYFAKKIY